MAIYIIERIEVNRNILDDKRYDPMFSVETVNRLASNGVPFRDAYKQVGLQIEEGTFVADKEIHHTHEGSIGNLCNDRIAALMESIYGAMNFEKAQEAEEKLIRG